MVKRHIGADERQVCWHLRSPWQHLYDQLKGSCLGLNEELSLYKKYLVSELVTQCESALALYFRSPSKPHFEMLGDWLQGMARRTIGIF